MSMIIPLKIRKQIRNWLTCNWAGGCHFSINNSVLVQRTMFPSFTALMGGRYEIVHGPGIEYRAIMGKSDDPKADYTAGRKIGFFGRIRGTVLPPRMLGKDEYL